MTKANWFCQTQFLMSVAEISKLPKMSNAEVAFAGRSNVGKSSTINTITDKKIAHVSKTPGRTQMLNFFQLTDSQFLVDLPGYGYADVPKAVKAQWHQLLEDYLATRHCLRGVVVIMDIRHPLQELDRVMCEWLAYHQRPMHVLFNKADKLGFGKKTQVLHRAAIEIKALHPNASCQLFSAQTQEGLNNAQSVIYQWLNPSRTKKDHCE